MKKKIKKLFFKNNGKNIIISIIAGFLLYYLITFFYPLDIICPPEQAVQCFLIAWGIFFGSILILSGVIFFLIKLIISVKNK